MSHRMPAIKKRPSFLKLKLDSNASHGNKTSPSLTARFSSSYLKLKKKLSTNNLIQSARLHKDSSVPASPALSSKGFPSSAPPDNQKFGPDVLRIRLARSLTQDYPLTDSRKLSHPWTDTPYELVQGYRATLARPQRYSTVNGSNFSLPSTVNPVSTDDTEQLIPSRPPLVSKWTESMFTAKLENLDRQDGFPFPIQELSPSLDKIESDIVDTSKMQHSSTTLLCGSLPGSRPSSFSYSADALACPPNQISRYRQMRGRFDREEALLGTSFSTYRSSYTQGVDSLAEIKAALRKLEGRRSSWSSGESLASSTVSDNFNMTADTSVHASADLIQTIDQSGHLNKGAELLARRTVDVAVQVEKMTCSVGTQTEGSIAERKASDGSAFSYQGYWSMAVVSPSLGPTFALVSPPPKDDDFMGIERRRSI